MIYEIVKIAHLASMVLWMGAVITVSMAVLILARQTNASPTAAITALRSAYVRLGGIGIVATWIFGLTLLSLGGWFQAPWMWAKIALVVVLSGLHGALSGRLKRLLNDQGAIPTGFFSSLLALHGLGLLTVLVLAVSKPF